MIAFVKNKSARAMLFACEADLRAGAKTVLSLVCFVLHTKLPYMYFVDIFGDHVLYGFQNLMS